MLKQRWTKVLLFLLCLAPVFWVLWRAWNEDLTANPIEYITHFTGDWTIRLIVLTLAVTPLRKLLGLPDLIRFRRMIGLYAFFYGTLHFLTYIWLDKFFDLAEMWKDVVKRPYITAGFTAFVLMIPLGGHIHQRLDPAHGREALATAAPADLCQRHRGRGALLLAGEERYTPAGDVRRIGGCAAALPDRGVDGKAYRVEGAGSGALAGRAPRPYLIGQPVP